MAPRRFVCRYWYFQEACWLHLQGSPRRVTMMDCFEDGSNKLLQNVCSCIPTQTVTSQKTGMFDTMFLEQRIINTWWKMTMFFTHNPWDASTLISQYPVIGISTWPAECNEIKGHNNNADVIYQIVAIKISFQFSRMPTQCEANYTFSEKPIHNTWKVTQGGQNPRLLIIYLEFI